MMIKASRSPTATLMSSNPMAPRIGGQNSVPSGSSVTSPPRMRISAEIGAHALERNHEVVDPELAGHLAVMLQGVDVQRLAGELP